MIEFERVIIVGRGITAVLCAQRICAYPVKVQAYNVDASFIQYDKTYKALNISYYECKKDELTQKLENIKESTLIVSIASTYIIPSFIIAKENITAINYHNALLPKHRGRHAEAWAIYEMDQQSGVSWHYINSVIDAGEIIIQKEIPIDIHTNSITLLRLQNEAAVKTFDCIFDDIINMRPRKCLENKVDQSHIHFSWDRPNDSWLDINWDSEQLIRFLNSFNYGILRTLGYPKLKLDNNVVLLNSYYFFRQEEEHGTDIQVGTKDITIYKGRYRIILKEIMNSER